MTNKKPSRRDLLRVIASVQQMIGEARGAHANDRDPEAFERAQTLLARAMDICDEARQYDAPGPVHVVDLTPYGSRVWMEFSAFSGPFFYRGQNSEQEIRSPSRKTWDAFEVWHREVIGK